MRKWFSWVFGQISLIFLWICGTLDAETAVDNITWCMNEITEAMEKEKKIQEIAEQQARYQTAVKAGKEMQHGR